MKEKKKQDYFHVSLKDSIATKLLRYVFSVYLIVAIVVTVIHMVSEYQRVKGNIIEDIKIIHLNANPTMAIALWEADKEQMLSILDGMVKSPTILGVKMSDLSGQYVLEKGETIDSGSEVRFPAKGGAGVFVKKKNSDLFGYQFPIVISSKGKRHELGRITIFSSSAVIFSRVQYSYLFIVINAIIKTIVLWIVFLWVSRFLLRRPLYTLTSAAKQIELDNLENIQIDTNSKGKNELTILAETLKDMIQKLLRARKELYENRDQLEIRVNERTAELTEAYTKLKIEEDALKQAKQNADEANKAKSLFLANMSHELRTPLNVILGFSELLARSPNLSSDQLTSLQTIGRSGEHLLALINNVLEFSKIEAGKIELTSERFDLHGFLLGLEEMFRLRAAQKGLALKFILDDDVPTHIRADQNKLRQVLINLLGNAVKFTDEGSITLDLDFDSNSDGVIDSLDDYYNSGSFWQPIGDSTNPFTGTFNGIGFEIRNLVCYRPSEPWVGLFGALDGATVSDLGLVGDLTSVTGNSPVGVISGWATNSSTISNCFVTGTVHATATSAGGAAVTLDSDGNLFVAGWVNDGQKAVLWKFRPGPDGIGDVCDDDIDGDGLLNTDEENKYGTDPTVADAFNDSNNSGGGCFIGTL